MAKTKRVPALRFRGFREEWKNSELASIACFYKGHGYSKDDLEESGVPIVLYGRLYTRYQAVISNVDTYVQDRKGSIFSSGKEVIIPASGETAEDIARASAIVQSDVILGGDLNIIYPNEQVNPIFMAFGISNGSPQREISKRAQGKTIVHLHNSDLLDIRISYPDINEQIKIGDFLQNLDALITLHKRRHDKLSIIKKAMLEKMFPKEGANVPEIRFKGFSGKWDKRTLGQLYEERNENGNRSLPILSVSIHDGVSNDELDSDSLGKQVRRSEDRSLYKRVYSGDLVFNMMRAWQGAIGVVKAEGMVSPAYITAIPNEQVYPPFMDYCLSRSHIVTQMNNLSYGVTDFRKRLYWDSFVRVECHIPTVSEQAKIAGYFEHLDSLITLQQRELDKLKSIKQACLEKMFV